MSGPALVGPWDWQEEARVRRAAFAEARGLACEGAAWDALFDAMDAAEARRDMPAYRLACERFAAEARTESQKQVA